MTNRFRFYLKTNRGGRSFLSLEIITITPGEAKGYCGSTTSKGPGGENEGQSAWLLIAGEREMLIESSDS